MTKSKIFLKEKRSLEIQNLVVQQEHFSAKPQAIPDSILGIDYGEKFTGFSWAHLGTIVPLEIWPTHEAGFLKKIKEVCESKAVKMIVYGLPLGSDGSENHICQTIRKKAKEVFQRLPIPFEFINERFSSQMTIRPDKKSRVDDLAAMQILEFFLSKKIRRSLPPQCGGTKTDLARKSCPKTPSIL